MYNSWAALDVTEHTGIVYVKHFDQLRKQSLDEPIHFPIIVFDRRSKRNWDQHRVKINMLIKIKSLNLTSTSIHGSSTSKVYQWLN